MSWNQYFIEMLHHIASKSKDNSTRVGAIIVDKNNIIVATGFNGFPRKVKEYNSEHLRRKRPLKYIFTEHAERNAIFAAARKGIPLENCKIYQSWLPCTDCTRAIIQTGINSIIIDGRDYENQLSYWNERWYDNMIYSCDMLRESQVVFYFWRPKYLGEIPNFDYRKAGEIKWHKVQDIGIIQ